MLLSRALMVSVSGVPSKAASRSTGRRLALLTDARLAGEDINRNAVYQHLAKQLAKLEDSIDARISALYALPVPEDPVDELVRLAEAEGRPSSATPEAVA